MLDVEGLELTSEEREMLQHPSVGGVILFSRNYHDPQQLQALTQSMRQASGRPLLIAIDHEGGRVQRCREHFSAIPAMADFESLASNEAEGERWASQMGWLMAAEVLACGIDFSFAPVLDVNGCSEVIGDRAFSQHPEEVARLARAFIQGMQRAGMQATGKHFPGHGSVQADSHFEVPRDGRSLSDIRSQDLPPFTELMGELRGIMPAHVIYTEIDPLPAGFSHFWLQNILRQEMKFDGVIFSDDLAMQGATVVGDMQSRAEQAFSAGCDMVLVCNDRAGAIQVLDRVTIPQPQRPFIQMMAGQPPLSWSQLKQSTDWQLGQQVIQQLRTRADR
nr:beta-N-acetylhexosaminidase [Aliidiomarina minuta]